MNNSISKEFNLSSLIKFSLPTIIMMLFMALYTIVDGVFVSRIVGINGLSAINIIEPLMNLFFGAAIMFGTGGSAIIGRKIGEKKDDEANGDLSLIVLTVFIISAVMSVISLLFLDKIIYFLGASDVLFKYCYDYLKICLTFIPLLMFQLVFSSLFVTAGKPALGLAFTIIAGITNIFLDYIFMVPMDMGISGAALGTTIGYMIPSAAGLIFFIFNKKGLHFGKIDKNLKVLTECMTNGASEMVGHVSMCITNWMFNVTLMRMLGEQGVAAISLLLYAQFLFNSMYMGFSSGVAPIISYNFGSENKLQLQRIFKNSIKIIMVSTVTIFVMSLVFAQDVVSIFIPKSSDTYGLAIRAYLLFSVTFLFSGFNIFASSMFTALSNGKISALISFMRTFVFIAGAIILLPLVIGVDGLWLAIPIAEVLALIISITCIVKQKDRYNYIN
ncbi:MATE family efflux transporter [Anaerofustis stercorihominis]|uniref:Multidrug export protein MepA n=1 Tax=Anaerofustis stercorihominis TaxID=214853 RepID=A0A3E3DYZ9_9FIRM|nr:MATE family efflux transporter [Anaerofustis stercorihominis]RGD74514.1 MATE family efflux transporter [Anaerofustis stercorihominis]